MGGVGPKGLCRLAGGDRYDFENHAFVISDKNGEFHAFALSASILLSLQSWAVAAVWPIEAPIYFILFLPIADFVYLTTNGRYTPTVVCGDTVTSLRGERSADGKCAKSLSLYKVKTHTSEEILSGTDAYIEVALYIYNKATKSFTDICATGTLDQAHIAEIKTDLSRFWMYRAKC